MSANCCAHTDTRASAPASPRYQRVLWLALLLNAAMAAIEIGGGIGADSVSLLADAADFFGDAVNYALSLAALAMAAAWRSRAAAFKGATMVLYGAGVLSLAAWNAWHGVSPEPATMGVIGALALAVNVGVAALLYAYRAGDANMRSVWLCSRNDAIGNLAVLLAALGVFGTGTMWPDLLVAALMAALALRGGMVVLRSARAELRGAAAHALPHATA